MQQFIKDHSFVNRLIFPAPEAQYSVNSFPRQLCWIPRSPEGRPDHSSFGREPLPATDDRIPCLWLPYHRPSKRVIFYAHGNGEDLGNTHRFVRMLRDSLHCHVIAVEYPGYGISPGTTTESTVNADALTVFQFVIDVMGFEASDVLLFGRSIGSGPCCQLAARFRVGGVVLVSPFASIREMTRHLAGSIAAAFVADRFSNINSIARCEAPIIFVHGIADDLVPYSHSQQLFRAAEKSERRAVHFPEDMDHNNFDLKEDILLPITLHFPDFFVRGSLRHKSWMPPFAFLKPIEYSALRDKHKHSASSPGGDRRATTPSPPADSASPRRSPAAADKESLTNQPTNRPSTKSEYEHQLAHLSMLYPDLDEAECADVLKLCKGNLARAAEVVVRLNLVAPGPTSSTDSAALVPELHSHLKNHRHNWSSSKSRQGRPRSALQRHGGGLGDDPRGRHAVQSPPGSPRDRSPGSSRDRSPGSARDRSHSASRKDSSEDSSD